jgi:hypothetical protein
LALLVGEPLVDLPRKREDADMPKDPEVYTGPLKEEFEAFEKSISKQLMRTALLVNVPSIFVAVWLSLAVARIG